LKRDKVKHIAISDSPFAASSMILAFDLAEKDLGIIFESDLLHFQVLTEVSRSGNLDLLDAHDDA
jgi:hypothetical protein